MKSKFNTLPFFVAFSAAFLLQLSSFAQINPKSDFFKPGVFSKKSSQKIVTSMLMMGQPMDMKMDMDYEMGVKVLPPKGKEQLITVSFKKATGQMEQGGNKQDIPMDIKAMGEFKIYTDKNGVVTQVEGNTEVLQSLQQSGMGGFVTEKPYSQYIFVKETKKIGDSWIDSTLADKLLINHYKYIANSGGNAVLEVVSDIHMINDMEQQGMSIHQDLKGTLKGQVLVDRKSNMIVKTEGKMHVEGTMETMGQMIPLTIDSDMTEIVE